jgi:hypothetical protein
MHSFCGYELRTLEQFFVLIVKTTVTLDVLCKLVTTQFDFLCKLVTTQFDVHCKLVTTQFAHGFYVIERLKSTDKGALFDLGIFPEQVMTSNVISRSDNRQDGN